MLGRLTPKASNSNKNGFRQNKSILSFFGKAEKRDTDSTRGKPDVGLFFEDPGNHSGTLFANQHQTPHQHERSKTLVVPPSDSPPVSRFNEDATPIKKRRTSTGDADLLVRTPSPERGAPLATGSSDDGPMSEEKDKAQSKGSRTPKRRGGFVEDSSDDEDFDSALLARSGHTMAADPASELDFRRGHQVDDGENIDPVSPRVTTPTRPLNSPSFGPSFASDHDLHQRVNAGEGPIPSLNYEDTSVFVPGEFGEEDDLEKDDLFSNGEEDMERRWMEEQREMEVGLDEDSKSESGGESIKTTNVNDDFQDDFAPEEAVARCPICDGSMKGLSEPQASAHVNACLDGAASPLPTSSAADMTFSKAEGGAASGIGVSLGMELAFSRRFQRAAIARPAQSNPFTLAKDSEGKGSAFARLMSGHAEDAAWAMAAANEVQSRGKPAYQRTCPFYKIVPGFFICVDAFRYGKVEGQNAYFLSHFHSDHYIGLTSSWCHGPIYASKVTCNLMLQQLKVDPQWVVPLEFEEKTEVPNTNGVFVTMIPANHCPGSALFLFEKVIGKTKDGSPKMTRVLHCGDFRACPAHVNHPLLRPEVVDAVTGQTKQQVIDTCYLDTTYLTPKYSFPSQNDVIDACAQMCVSMSQESAGVNDSWERAKLERAGATMTKFFEQGENGIVKKEDHPHMPEQKPKLRGRLLVVIGTYSIGKERICLGIAKALNSKIYAPPGKMRVCLCLEDPELNSRLTSNPLEAQIHMHTLMEIRAETLHDYLKTYNGHFTRVVGFRPTGWSYRPPASRLTENPAVSTVLNSDAWKSRFTMRDLTPQRGSTRESNCFGVPYSEHSSFRELTMFCCALRINRIVPTVNVGSARTREKMKSWIEKWDAEKRKNGLFKVEADAEGWGSGDGQLRYGV